MIDAIRLADFRAKLETILAELDLEDALGSDSQKTVELDQQAVGRLSRMDAMQQQAMAKATQNRRAQMRARILAALERMQEDEFGYCMDCGDEIPLKRLDLDPTAALCVSCARG